jgi:hypothetical protein
MLLPHRYFTLLASSTRSLHALIAGVILPLLLPLADAGADGIDEERCATV